MNTLLSLFLLFLNHSLHQDVYYQITQFVYEHLEEMDNYSMTALADACHTSTVTIKKWMELFGLDNYKRFKERLRDTSLIRLAQIDARCQKVRSEQLVEKIRLLSGKRQSIRTCFWLRLINCSRIWLKLAMSIYAKLLFRWLYRSVSRRICACWESASILNKSDFVPNSNN